MKYSIQKAQTRIASLQFEIQNVKDISNRITFIKKKESGNELEFNKLVEEYVGKRKRVGIHLTGPIQDCRSFLKSGDLVKTVQQPATAAQQIGFFSGWNITGMFGYANMPNNQENSPQKSKEEETESLAIIAKADKDLSCDSICDTLTKLATKIGTTHPERMSVWLNQLQLCFGIMYRSCLNLYTESKEVEKLKDFLVGELEFTKQALEAAKKSNLSIQNELKNTIEVYQSLMKILDERLSNSKAEKCGYSSFFVHYR